MSVALREKANSFDRVLRQKSVNYLKDSEKHALRLMDLSYDKESKALLTRIDRLKSGVSQTKNDIEYGSFISLPALRSGRRFHTEAPMETEEEISQALLIGEIILLECRNLFEKLQDVERIFYEADETHILQLFQKAEESLRKIENLQRSRSNPKGYLLEAFILEYKESVDDIEQLAEKENLFAIEKNHLEGAFAMNKGTIFEKLISKLKRKPVFEKEIADTILSIGERLKTTTGGLVRLPALYSMVKMAKPSLNINMNDVEKTVCKLEKEGVIPGLRDLAGVKMVEMVPVTATPDQKTILDMASEEGKLTLEKVLIATKWTHERANRALKQMEEIGIAKYDTTSREWIFPAFSQEGELTNSKSLEV